MNENLFEGLDITEDKKTLMSEAFDKAVMAKSVELMDEHVDTRVAEKEAILKEEYEAKVSNLEDTIDGYMSSIVDDFMVENASKYEAEITVEKAKTILESFDKMCLLMGVDMVKIEEAKDDTSVVAENEKLNGKISELHDELVESKREADKYLRAGLINEMKIGLTTIEGEKFEKLAEGVPFGRNDTYSKSLENIVEAIKDARAPEFKEQDIKLSENAFKPADINVKAATDFNKYV